MSIVKRHLAEHEERLVLIKEICIDKGALVLDTVADEVFFSADEYGYKNTYVTEDLDRLRLHVRNLPKRVRSRLATRGDEPVRNARLR